MDTAIGLVLGLAGEGLGVVVTGAAKPLLSSASRALGDVYVGGVASGADDVARVTLRSTWDDVAAGVRSQWSDSFTFRPRVGADVPIGVPRHAPEPSPALGSSGAIDEAANTARSLPTPAEAADLLRAARPTGSALKSDAAHRAGDWVIDDVAQSGSVFELVGGDGVSRTLVQLPGEMNGVAGRFEWIIEGQDLTHQLFVRGGTINGIPIKP